MNRMNTVRQVADDAQDTMVSGRKLRRISDDPISTVRVLRNRSKLQNVGQFRKTLDFSRGFLQKTEDALVSTNETLVRAKELAVQQANATWDADARNAVAQELRQLADHVVGLANSSYADRYVFGGFQTSQPPFSPDGSFLGDDGVIFVQMDEDSFRPVSLPGREVFDPIPESGVKHEEPIVKSLRDMYKALSTNDIEGIWASIDKLEAGSKRVVNAVAVVGARRSAVEDVARRLDHHEELLLSDNNTLESADPFKAAMDLKGAETSLQSTLTSSSKLLTPSLLNFLQ
jgi:flagellar hook-associated protein 3 FlgL